VLVQSKHIPQPGLSLDDEEQRDEMDRLRWITERKTA
jgi:hypothetical protein